MKKILREKNLSPSWKFSHFSSVAPNPSDKLSPQGQPKEQLRTQPLPNCLERVFCWSWTVLKSEPQKPNQSSEFNVLESKTALNLPEPQREALRQSNSVNSRELTVFLFTFRFVSGSKTSLLSTKQRKSEGCCRFTTFDNFILAEIIGTFYWL